MGKLVMDFDVDSLINGGLAFAAVLSLMILNVPVGISMLFVGFVGFALISGFDPAMVVPLSLQELKSNKFFTKGRAVELRAMPDQFLKHLSHYKLIYGTSLNLDEFKIRSNKKMLLEDVDIIRRGYLPSYEGGELDFQDLLKRVFWLIELEQIILGHNPSHSFQGIVDIIKDKQHVVHEAFKLRINPKRNRKIFMAKLLQYLSYLEKEYKI